MLFKRNFVLFKRNIPNIQMFVIPFQKGDRVNVFVLNNQTSFSQLHLSSSDIAIAW